jgi:hypothetical protein
MDYLRSSLSYIDLLCVYYTYVHVMQDFFARFCSLIKMSLTPVEDNQGVRLLMETFALCISFTEHYVDYETHEQLLLNMFHRAFDFYKIHS